MSRLLGRDGFDAPKRIFARSVVKMQPYFVFLAELSPFYLWCYEGIMEIVNFLGQHGQGQYVQIGASGDCPHCSARSYFAPRASYQEVSPNGAQWKILSAAQCESCKGFILVIGKKGNASHPAVLEAIYPLGKPKDNVDANVPEDIADDFREALRSRWGRNYKSTVVMCRRAIQSSAIDLKAKDAPLVAQIEDLFKKGKITEPLKDFAHAVRLTGNDGAHPDKDGLKDVKEKDADDIIAFTQEFLHHVYVMPALLKARLTPAVPTPPPGQPPIPGVI